MAACLKQAMGEAAFQAFAARQRPPTSAEEALIGECYGKTSTGPQGTPGAGGPMAGSGSTAFSWENPPRFVKHNFIELDRIEKISKFRGGYGHDYSQDTPEAGGCRSMKHYYWAKGWEPDRSSSASSLAVRYFAPVNGTVIRVQISTTPSGEEARFDIQSDEYPGLNFGFFHVKLLSSIKESTRVTAGQHIGTIAGAAHGEIALLATYPIVPSGLLSFFDVVEDSVFEEYKKRGVSSRQDFIITREERERNPLTCDLTWEKRFTGARDTKGLPFHLWQTGPDNWVVLK